MGVYQTLTSPTFVGVSCKLQHAGSLGKSRCCVMLVAYITVASWQPTGNPGYMPAGHEPQYSKMRCEVRACPPVPDISAGPCSNESQQLPPSLPQVWNCRPSRDPYCLVPPLSCIGYTLYINGSEKVVGYQVVGSFEAFHFPHHYRPKSPADLGR